MKRKEQLAHLQKMSVADTQKEIREIEKKLQATRLNVAFGKSKQVREIRALKRQLARTLTVGNQKVRGNV